MNREKKWTQGEYVTKYNGSFFEIKTIDGNCIAEVFHDDKTFETSLPKFSEAESTVALISAAPELVEAIEDVWREIIEPMDLELDHTLKPELDKLKAALAKAYGEVTP